MYKKTSSRTKTRKIFMFLLMLIMFIYSYPLIETKINRFRTLGSLKPIGNAGVYSMKYELNYKLDDFIKNGSKDLNQLYYFIDKNTSVPFTSNSTTPVFKYDIYDINSYDGYDECTAFSAINEQGAALFGRNLDIKGNHPILVLQTDPPNGYASISIVEIPILGCTDDNEQLKTLFRQYGNRTPLLRSPYMPRDGMNEKGLCVATLNVPNEDINIDAEKSTLGRWQVLRLLLDKASNLKEAIELLEKYNCFDGTVHYFISDAYGNSAVAEYIEGKLSVVPSLNKFQTVTNFYLSQPDKGGKGHKRYDTAHNYLKEHYKDMNETSALKLLSDVKEQSTVYSAVYNQRTGEVFISYKNDYYNIYNFKLNMK